MFVAIGAVLMLAAAQPDRADLHNWKVLRSDTGEVYQIFLPTITHFSNGEADVEVYIHPYGQTEYDPRRSRYLRFDCHGQFQDITDGFGPVMDAPPKSMAGAIAVIVCKRT